MVRSDPAVKLWAQEPKSNFAFVRPKEFRKTPEVPFIKRPASLLAPMIGRGENTQLEALRAEIGANNQFIRDDKAPVRQYYHSQTNLPLLEGDWDQDSDEEATENWIIRENGEVSLRCFLSLSLCNIL